MVDFELCRSSLCCCCNLFHLQFERFSCEQLAKLEMETVCFSGNSTFTQCLCCLDFHEDHNSWNSLSARRNQLWLWQCVHLHLFQEPVIADAIGAPGGDMLLSCPLPATEMNTQDFHRSQEDLAIVFGCANLTGQHRSRELAGPKTSPLWQADFGHILLFSCHLVLHCHVKKVKDEMCNSDCMQNNLRSTSMVQCLHCASQMPCIMHPSWTPSVLSLNDARTPAC